MSIPGVGSKIAAKVSEFLASGHLRKVEEICGSERSQVVELFTKVWGVGPATAQSWFQQVTLMICRLCNDKFFFL